MAWRLHKAFAGKQVTFSDTDDLPNLPTMSPNTRHDVPGPHGGASKGA
jgi:hypothetical protein